MIKQTNLRDKGFGANSLGAYETRPTQALENLLMDELAHGGVVKEVSYTKIVVGTHILGQTVDTTIFEGPLEEMELIVKVAACHVALTNNSANLHILSEKIELTFGTNNKFLMGQVLAAMSLLFAGGITTDFETIKTLAGLSIEDLVSAVDLYRRTGAPLPKAPRETAVV